MKTTAGWATAALAILAGLLATIPAAAWAWITRRNPFWLYHQ